jgi:hypothetical protein
VTEQQLRLLQRKKLPFELVAPPNGRDKVKRDA